MELRAATAADVDAVRSVARESLVASYGHAVGEQLLDEAVEEWYDAEDLGAHVHDYHALFPVSVVPGHVLRVASRSLAAPRARASQYDFPHVHPSHPPSRISVSLL
mgnify:CR=1 FL=1